MCHLRLRLLLLTLLILMHCVATAPGNRYIGPSSSRDMESSLPDRGGWLVPDPFLRLVGARLQRGLTAVNGHHHLEKRKCNTATCVTQRLADFLVRSGNNHYGTDYAPTNVGATTYGKRDLRRPASYLAL